mmetsp:Transcript_54488/g.118551  ORF Transcript_54488/g.118551 Transcript_54488/m.118551 type:complete len:111 (-) Transcript_54488:350-682(-)
MAENVFQVHSRADQLFLCSCPSCKLQVQQRKTQGSLGLMEGVAASNRDGVPDRSGLTSGNAIMPTPAQCISSPALSSLASTMGSRLVRGTRGGAIAAIAVRGSELGGGSD